MDLSLEEQRENGRVARRLSVFAGSWLFISAFIWNHTVAERTNSWILGVLSVALALAAPIVPAARRLQTALSIWLVVSVWALPHHDLATTWSNVIVAFFLFLASLVPGEPRAAAAHAPA